MKFKYLLPVCITLVLFSCKGKETRTESARLVVPDTTAGGAQVQPVIRNMREPELKMKEEINAMEFTGDADHDFAALISRHHRAAIDMCKMEIEYGDRELIKQAAQKLLDEMRTDNLTLDAFLQRDQPGATAKKDFEKGIRKIMQRPEPGDGSVSSMDDLFLVIMKRQLKKAVDCANLYIPVAGKPEPETVARRIVARRKKTTEFFPG